MPKNKIPKLREPKGPIVQQVRDLFLKNEYKLAPNDFYLEDIKLIENMDFLLQRYIIIQRKNVDSSVKLVSEILKWRKEKNLYDMNINQFPQELTICGAAFTYEDDKFGNKTLYLRANMCKNCNELKSSLKDFLTYLLFQIDDSKNGSTFSVIMDLTNTSWNNYDLDLLMHILALLKDYFPVNLDYVLAINFPWILSAAWALIKRLIPNEKRDIVQFISSDKIFDYVSKESCPDFLGGTCQRSYQFINENSPTVVEYLLNLDKPPTIKRIKEILVLFNGSLPKDHLDKLMAQLESHVEGCSSNTGGIVEKKTNDNNNNSDEQKRKSIEKVSKKR